MCVRCKYCQNGDCEFLLLPETCDEFDLGDKFDEKEEDKIKAMTPIQDNKNHPNTQRKQLF